MLGRELAAMINQHFDREYKLLGFIDDHHTPHDNVNGIYVLGGMEWLLAQEQSMAVFMAVADPGLRQTMVQRIAQQSNLSFPNLVHPTASVSSRAFTQLGRGNIIFDQSVLSVNVRLGSFNLLYYQNILTHDTAMGDFNTLMAGVILNGGVELGSACLLGHRVCATKALRIPSGSKVPDGSILQGDFNAV